MDDATAFKTPGQYLSAALDKRGWTQRVLAIVLDAEETGINRLLADKRTITADMAVALEDVLGINANALLSLQSAQDLARARYAKLPDPTRATRAQLFGELPVADMIRRGWLDASSVRDVVAVEAALTSFFGVERLQDIPTLPHAAKKTEVFSPATPSQIAWLYRVRQITVDMLVPRYSTPKGRALIGKLGNLLSAPEEARHVPRLLAEAGIRYAVVEQLPSAKIDGVCFWLDEVSPVIGMSMRFDRIDNFWFVLRHELEHVLLGHGRSAVMLDVELEGDKAGNGPGLSEEELLANRAAADFCVPEEQLQRFVARKAPLFLERDIIGFARTLGVHSGLVAGQLRRKTGRYDRFGNHLSKIRSVVARSALVDGWGDVAPVGN